jgi:chromosome segregation ATPase
LSADGDASGEEVSSLQRRYRELEETLQTMNDDIAALGDQDKAFDQRVEVLDRKKKDLTKLKQKVVRMVQQIKNQLMRQQKNLRNLEEEEYTEEREAELVRELSSTVKKQVTKIVSCVDSYGEYTNAHFKSVPVHMELESAKAKCNRLQHQLRSQRIEFDHADSRVNQVQRIFDEEKDSLRDLKKDAEKSAPLNDQSRELFAKLPSNFDELDDLIINLGSEINSLIVADPNVVEDHNEILASIDELTAKVAKGEKKFDLHEGGRLIMHDKWLNPLLEVVQQLNVKFSSLFADLGFVGEVRLRKEVDYSKYAIEIWVKFREEDQLSILTSTVQSGGERSVSTIIYLIALQKLTPCPFRVIDEINQGMDAVNERLVFKKLVEEACAPNSPQCFLLTPKILPGLSYSEDVTILNIFNGPYTKDVDHPEWKRHKFLESDVAH